MENRCFYLHATAAGTLEKRYWFGIKPTLNKLVVQYRQQNAGEDFEPEILEALRAEAQKGALAGATWRVIVGPEADLPEQKGLTLLVLQPSLAWGEDEASREAVRQRVLALSDRFAWASKGFTWASISKWRPSRGRSLIPTTGPSRP